MKLYIKSSAFKIPFELLGWIVNNEGTYRKVWLTTRAISFDEACKNFRNQVYRYYPGWSLVEDKMNVREDIGPQFNKWIDLPEGSKILE